jgi:hypothetical protein
MVLLKRIILFVLVSLPWSASAAGKYYHELQGNLNMFTSSLAPVPSQTNRFGLGFGGGIGYVCHFTDEISIRTGINGNYYRSTTGISEISETSTIRFPDEWNWWDQPGYTDPPPPEDLRKFDFTSRLESYTAQQSALFLQIPVLFEYTGVFPSLEHLGWYVAAGLKMGYMITGSSDASIENMSTKAKLHYENVEISNTTEDEMFNKNFGWGLNNVNENVNSKLELGINGVAYLEAGFTQQLTPRYILYAGIFGEYNVYSLATNSTSSTMIEYEPLAEEIIDDKPYYHLRYNPAAQLSVGGAKSTYFLSAGITVRIGFILNRRATKRNDRLFNVRYFQY